MALPGGWSIFWGDSRETGSYLASSGFGDSGTWSYDVTELRVGEGQISSQNMQLLPQIPLTLTCSSLARLGRTGVMMNVCTSFAQVGSFAPEDCRKTVGSPSRNDRPFAADLAVAKGSSGPISTTV